MPAGAKKSIALHGASARAPLEASSDAVGYRPWYELDFRASVHVSSLIHRDGLRAAADCEKISPRLERLVIHRIGPIFCMRRSIMYSVRLGALDSRRELRRVLAAELYELGSREFVD